MVLNIVRAVHNKYDEASLAQERREMPRAPGANRQHRTGLTERFFRLAESPEENDVIRRHGGEAVPRSPAWLLTHGFETALQE